MACCGRRCDFRVPVVRHLPRFEVGVQRARMGRAVGAVAQVEHRVDCRASRQLAHRAANSNHALLGAGARSLFAAVIRVSAAVVSRKKETHWASHPAKPRNTTTTLSLFCASVVRDYASFNIGKSNISGMMTE